MIGVEKPLLVIRCCVRRQLALGHGEVAEVGDVMLAANVIIKYTSKSQEGCMLISPGERNGVIPGAGVLHWVHGLTQGLPHLGVAAVLLVAVRIHQAIQVQKVGEGEELGDGWWTASRGIVNDLPNQEGARHADAETQGPRRQGRAVLIGQQLVCGQQPRP